MKSKFEGKHSELTGKILGAFFQLHKEMGLVFRRGSIKLLLQSCLKNSV
jgi:hypothetical protein